VPEAASGSEGLPLVAKELVVLITMEKRKTRSPANVVIRGISQDSFLLRPQVKVAVGRVPKAGSSEIIIGKSIEKGFEGADLGKNLFFAMRSWTIVGVFDAGSTGFSSEIWGDVDQLMQAFRRPVYSSVLFKLRESSEFEQVRNRIESDPRLTLEAKRETTYYKDQSEMMAKFLRILGFSLTLVFSIGAVVGGMITMYASVANRTREIGTLRALGFKRSSVLIAFLTESLLLGLLGGAAGLFFSSFLQLFTVSTTNFQTFSELAFSFSLDVSITLKAMSFALAMGFVGGILPALRASGMGIVDALREA
jgi:ABC-type antimicrobial peptide transport system permease subunit